DVGGGWVWTSRARGRGIDTMAASCRVGWLDRDYVERVERVSGCPKSESPRDPPGAPERQLGASVLLGYKARLRRRLTVEHQVARLETSAAQGECQNFVKIFHHVHLEGAPHILREIVQIRPILLGEYDGPNPGAHGAQHL